MNIKTDNWLLSAGYILSFVLGACVSLALADPDLSLIGGKVNLSDWLSFVGSVLGAGLAVYGAILATRMQLEKQGRAEQAQRERELNAARSILASDLSDLMQYVADSAIAIDSAVGHLIHRGPAPALNIPNINPEIPLRFANLVSLAPPDVSDQISELLRELQIQRARLTHEIQGFMFPNQGRRRGVMQGPHNFDAALESTVSLHTQINNLFDYARRKTEVVHPAAHDARAIQNALFSLGLDSLADPEMIDRLSMSFGIH